jgi:hypothetical protein
MSISSDGLDVSLMGAVAGIAGSTEAEAQGIHLVDQLDEAWWYASFRHHDRVDIWQIRAAGLQLERSTDGWLCREVIAPKRLTLVERDVTADEASQRLDLTSAQHGGLTGDMTAVLKDPNSPGTGGVQQDEH